MDKKTESVFVRMTRADRLMLERVAKDEDRTLSGLIRRVIREYLRDVDKGELP